MYGHCKEACPKLKKDDNGGEESYKEVVGKDGKSEKSVAVNDGNIRERKGLNLRDEIFDNYGHWMLAEKKHCNFDGRRKELLVEVIRKEPCRKPT